MTEQAARGFSENLRLVMSRLNLSRVELAHRLGVDKSVVRRWVLGSTRPTDTNLSGLTELAAAATPGFTRDHWRLAPADLAAVLGLAPGAPTAAAAAAPPAASAPGLEGLLSAFIGRADSAGDQALNRYGGLWARMAVAGAQAGQRLMVCTAVLVDGSHGRLWVRGHDGAAGMANIEGPGFVVEDRLWVLAERQPRGSDLTVMLLDGASGPLHIIDGLYLVRAPNTGVPVAGRCLFFRLADLPADPAGAQALLDAAGARAGELSGAAGLAQLPPWAADLITGHDETVAAFPRQPLVVTVPPAANLTSVRIDIDILPRRGELLEAVRGLFAEALSEAGTGA